MNALDDNSLQEMLLNQRVNSMDYAAIALQVPGVISAWVGPRDSNVPDVIVNIVCHRNAPPDIAKEVQDYILEKRQVGIHVTVKLADAERTSFEEWIVLKSSNLINGGPLKDHGLNKFPDGSYHSYPVQWAWNAWQHRTNTVNMK